ADSANVAAWAWDMSRTCCLAQLWNTDSSSPAVFCTAPVRKPSPSPAPARTSFHACAPTEPASGIPTHTTTSSPPSLPTPSPPPYSHSRPRRLRLLRRFHQLFGAVRGVELLLLPLRRGKQLVPTGLVEPLPDFRVLLGEGLGELSGDGCVQLRRRNNVLAQQA